MVVITKVLNGMIIKNNATILIKYWNANVQKKNAIIIVIIINLRVLITVNLQKIYNFKKNKDYQDEEEKEESIIVIDNVLKY